MEGDGKMSRWLIIILPLLLTGCFEEKWSAFFYPNKDDLTTDEFLGNYSSLEDCRQAAVSHIRLTNNDNADYECGLNCDISQEKPYICEKTER